MSKSQETYSKKEKEKKRLKKRQDKQKKKEEAKASGKKAASFEDMIAYVDEFGNITDTPPDPTKKKEVIDESSIVLGVPKKDDVFEDPIHHGKVDFFDTSKGFGFIHDSDNGEKYFYHINNCIDEIGEGDKVSFELEQGMKGLNAVRVKKDKPKPKPVVVAESDENSDSETESETKVVEAPESKSESAAETSTEKDDSEE